MKWVVAILVLCTTLAGAGVVEDAGVKGGLAVVIGGEDVALLKELGAAGFTVQALEADPAKAAAAHQALWAAGVYGKVSVIQHVGERLPYVDNLVNLIVISHQSTVTSEEIERVLAPRGVLLAPSSLITDHRSLITQSPAPKGWHAYKKAVPPEIDDWPMHMYEPGNNAVSRDTTVGPPRRLQWRSGPEWTRSHEFASSLNAMVSMSGKLFYVMDEGSRFSPLFRERWRLVCRDAFSGIVLWKRDLPSWHTHWWPVKSGPTQAMRRLVAVGEKLYLPLGVDEPLSELDAGTGKVLRTFKGTKGIEEVRMTDGMAYLLTSDAVKEQQGFDLKTVEVWHAAGNATGQFKWDDRPRTLTALDLATGESAWQVKHPVMTLSLALDDSRLYFHNGNAVVALARSTGKLVWTSEAIEMKGYKLGTATAPSLLVHDGVVVCTDGFDFKDGSTLALAAASGKTLWRKVHQSSGHSSPDDIHVIDGLLWEGGIARIGKQGGMYRGFDLKTGDVKREFPLDVEHGSWFHQRCYRSRATENYLMPAATGIEYVDVRAEHWQTHHWVRGACLYGILPANGLTYATPHPCACFMESMVRGFSALAPESARPQDAGPEIQARLIKGPGYRDAASRMAKPKAEDWPMYRRDPARSGYAQTVVEEDVRQAWATSLGGKITPPVAAGGMVVVAAIDRHTVHALDQDTGNMKWSFTAAGRVDSAPTLYRGLALFGSADGWLYCLDAKDGILAWKRQVAPQTRLITDDGQVESAWPVSGSVLIANDKAYVLAGRSIFLNGGMHLAIVNPLTGEIIDSKVHSDIDPETGKSMQLSNSGLKMVPSNADLLSFDGEHIYMKAQRIGLDGERIFPDDNPKKRQYTLSKSDQEGPGAHLFSPPGFLDSAWHHRSYWLYGKASGSGWGGWMKPGKYVPAGKILVVDASRNVFGFGREPAFFAQSHVMEFHFFSAKGGVYEREDWRKPFSSIREKKASITNWKQNRELPIEKMSAVQFNWREEEPEILVRALVGAGDRLFLAGPPDTLDETTLHGRFLDPAVIEQIDKQEQAFEGQVGGKLLVMSAQNGERLSEMDIESLPVFDGLIAANGKLFMSSVDGQVICYE